MGSFLSVVDGLTNSPSIANVRKLTACIHGTPPTDDDLAYLATILAHSGVVREPPELYTTADLASTGGPSSLSTLVSPLYLRALGYRVPKLGVPGRPAGGIDVMAQIPGFRFRLNAVELDKVLRLSGYAHFLADNTFAPLDMKLFHLRQKINAQAIPVLAITSILSKKLAVGVSRVGLEVRVAPHGNLGSTWEVARENANCFCRVSKLLGIDSIGILTDARYPYQPYIGRGEALVALEQLFEGNAGPQLKNHFDLCFALAASTSRKPIRRRPTPKELEKAFASHLQAQGSGLEAFRGAVKKIRSQPLFPLFAKRQGYVRIDLGKLRTILGSVQAEHSSSRTPFPDPCGLVLQASPNEYVWKGDIIAQVRVEKRGWKKLERGLNKAFSIVDSKALHPYFEEVSCV